MHTINADNSAAKTDDLAVWVLKSGSLNLQIKLAG